MASKQDPEQFLQSAKQGSTFWCVRLDQNDRFFMIEGPCTLKSAELIPAELEGRPRWLIDYYLGDDYTSEIPMDPIQLESHQNWWVFTSWEAANEHLEDLDQQVEIIEMQKQFGI